MSAESVLARIVDNPKLPTPPALTLNILERANRPNCSIGEIGKMIAHDPALCGKMLRMVNSSLLGLHHPVTSIERALNLLGLNHVRSLVLSLSLPSLRFQRASSEQMKTYWKSSVTIAIVCRELAILRKVPDPDSEMVAGLLCDLGMMLLQEAFPDELAALNRAVSAPEEGMRRQCELERQYVGVDHAEAGAHVLARWKLGDDLTEPIRFHHRPAEAAPRHQNRAYSLYFATQIAQLQRSLERGVDLAEIVSLARERYGLDDHAFHDFLESLNAKIDEFAALIEVDLGAHESFATLFARAAENLARLAVTASLDSMRVQEEKSQIERNLHDAKQALQSTEDRLRHAQKMEAIGRLAGGVAHDFNNLLTVIVGNCELLLEKTSLDADARELIEVIRSTGDRAAELTRQLLAFSRKQRLVSEVANLNGIIADMSKMLTRLIGNNVKLVTKLSDDLGLVKVDPSQIGQVILNLAVNARDAMPTGGSLTIETFNLQLDDDPARGNPDLILGRYAVFAVRDTGIGMDEATLPQIFEPFFTTKEFGKGTGLGLATVHGVVRQSGGHITVSSAIGQGTVFHVYLPIVDEPVGASRPDAIAPETGAGAATILLVEDENEVRDFAQRTLCMHGYQVLTARNGIEALEIGRSSARVDLLLTDKMMPWMNGAELVTQLTSHRPEIKIVYMSAYAEDAGARPLASTADIPFVQKPFTIMSLMATIQDALARPSPSVRASQASEPELRGGAQAVQARAGWEKSA